MLAGTINNIYIHDKGKIILFDNQRDITNFIQMYFQYATQRMMQEDPFKMGEILNAQNNVVIEEYNGIGAETITFEEVKKKYQK